ncbi:MAG: MBL fold metallo-hydrolase [Natrialbaceae archaeon]|nr:MBL fold metallo-hydrolase [Natrialbaceae archaeon]
MDRILLGNDEFEGRNAAYILADGDDLALVETGIATPPTRRQLFDGIEERGYQPEDVDDIVLTHWHPDHAGLAGEIQALSGATVYVHEADAPIVAGTQSNSRRCRTSRSSSSRRGGCPRRNARHCWPSCTLMPGSTRTDHADPDPGWGRTRGWRSHLETIHAPGHAGLAPFCHRRWPGSIQRRCGVARLYAERRRCRHPCRAAIGPVYYHPRADRCS